MQEELSPPIEAEINQELTQRYSPPYCVIDNCLCELRMTKDNVSKKVLCNFVPWITAQETVYDGEKEFNRLHLSGIAESGSSLREIEIDAKDFQSMNWLLEKWGADCNIAVGGGSREHIRYAIQSTMKQAERTSLYTVTGWLKVGGKYEYLMPDTEGLNVILPGKLRNYSLPPQKEETDYSAVKTMLTGTPATQKLMLPLLSFVFLSPLNHFLREVDAEPKSVLFLCGRTGTKKSTLAALILSFFGKFSASSLPLSFRDTGNSIVANLFSLKDVMTCIDDFHPSGRYEEGRMNTTAQTVMRAVGDRTGRARLNQRSELMCSKPPQGNVIITGEMPPEIGESGTARYLMLEVENGDVDESSLTSLQNVAENGGLQAVMREYICWLKERFLSSPDSEKGLLNRLKGDFLFGRKNFADKLSEGGSLVHARIPETLSNLMIGMEFLLDFLIYKDVICEEQKYQIIGSFILIAVELARRQSETVTADKPTQKFLSKLFALVDSGTLYLADKNEASDFKVIGYYDDDRYYLYGQEAHKTVRRFCEEQGEIFSITPKALFKALTEEGFAEKGNRENTKVLRIGGRQRHFLVLDRRKVDALLGTLILPDYPSQPSQTELPEGWEELNDDEELPF